MLQKKLQILLSLASTEGRIEVSNPYKIPVMGVPMVLVAESICPLFLEDQTFPNPGSP